MHRSSRLAALAATLFICAAGPTSAAVVYDEAISGDLPSDGALTSLALASGANTVRGSVTFSFNGATAPDSDTFIFNVPLGLSLTDIQFDAVLEQGGDGTFNSIGMRLSKSPGGLLGYASAMIPTENAALFASTLPLTAGDYRFDFYIFQGSLLSGQFRTASYEITLNLDGTPLSEPSSLALLLSVGLLAGAAARKARS